MATVGHGEATDHHDIPYGYMQKHYDQVHGWAQGYGGDHCVDYTTSQSSLPMNDQLYVMGSYRSGHPVVVRSNNVVYVDADASSYGYGNGGTATSLDVRSTSLPDPSHSFQNGMSCYSNAAVDHPGRIMPILADRCRSDPSSHAEGLADHRTSHLSPGVDGANMVDMNGSYHGYESGTCNGSSMDRNSSMYTTAPPDELLVHGGSLRSSIPDYGYRYAETTSDRGGQPGGGSMMAMEDAQYFSQSRGCYVGGNGLGPANNGASDGRGTSLAGLQG